jgi:hypothetical protein
MLQFSIIGIKRALMVSVLFLAQCQAATYFVRSGASGNGSSWANAWGNVSSISWSSLNPGDTVCVAGGAYSGSINTAKSGTSGNPITVRRVFASDATCGSSTTGWSSSYEAQAVIAGIGVNNNYVTIDGGGWVGGVQWSGGFYISLANADGSGVSVGGATSNVTLRYVEVAGPGGPSGVNQNADTRGINLDYWTGSGWAAASNWLIQYVNLHGQCTNFITYNSPSLTVEHSRFADSIDNTPGNPNCHPNVFEDGGGSNITLRYNEIVNWSVEGVMTCPNGACTTNVAIYGNVWHDPQNGSGGVARVLESQYNANGPHLLYNNTIINTPMVGRTANGGSFASGTQSRNNILWSSASPGLPDSDYDLSNSSLGETHGVTTSTSPFLNAAAQNIAGYHLSGNTTAGTNLGSPYNIDYDGNTRTTWDRGAFEFGGSNPGPNPPTGLAAIVQ